MFERDDLDSLAALCAGIPKSYAVSLYAKQKLFHMHIPKTGGTFLKNYFKNFPFEYRHNLHLKCDASQPLYPDPTDSIPREGMFQDQPGYSDSLRFCIIRNPFEWLTKDYREYYTKEMIDTLSEKWKDILNLFNYDFNGSTNESVIIDTQNLKYCKKTNKLWSE
jgi:hypothetical protein